MSIIGKHEPSLEKVNKEHKTKKPASLIDRWILLFGLIGFLVITAPIGYLIVQSVNKPPRNLRIDIKNKTSPQGGDFRVNECDNCNNLVIKDKTGAIIFEESLEDRKNNKLRTYLINKALEGDKKNTVLKLSQNKFLNRLVDISLDISNSTVERDTQSLKTKANIKYSDHIFQKLKEYMQVSNGILPRDTVNVRFYGPELKDNPCNAKLVIKYTESEWNADITYSSRNEQILIEIGDKLASKTEKNGLVLTTNDSSEVYKAIQNFYREGITNPNSGCHYGTYLIPHLIQISDDIVNKGYTEQEFVLVTDGEFYLRDDEITAGKEVYATPKNYEILKKYLQNKKNKEFKINGSTICKTNEDKFIIVGMEYDNNLSFRNIAQQFYNELLKPCQVAFENF